MYTTSNSDWQYTFVQRTLIRSKKICAEFYPLIFLIVDPKRPNYVGVCQWTVRRENDGVFRVLWRHLLVHYMDAQPLVQPRYTESVKTFTAIRPCDAFYVGLDALHGRATRPLPEAGRLAVRRNLHYAHATTGY